MAGEGLPFILRQVADIAGLDAAFQLARAHGGRRLYVPESRTPAFVNHIGEAAADALCQLYPNEAVDIPIGPAGALRQASLAAERAIRSGASASEAARLSGMTERAIWKRRARRRAELCSRQGRLFED